MKLTISISFVLLFLVNCSSDTVLIKNIKAGEVTQAAESIENNSPEWDKEGKFGLTPLHYASEYGHLDLVKKLIEKGADVNAESGTFYTFGKKEGYQTPLHLAIDYGHIEVAKYLISKGANINAKTYRNYTIMTIAWKKGLFSNDSSARGIEEKGKAKQVIEFVSSLNSKLDYSNESLAAEIISYYPAYFDSIDLFRSYMEKKLNLNCCNRVQAPMIGFYNLNSKEERVRKLSLEMLKEVLKKDIDLDILHHKIQTSNRTAFQRIFAYENPEAKEAQKLLLEKFPDIQKPEFVLKKEGREIFYGFADLLFFWWFDLIF
ncbi:ankyrin repeat domain-containing protein [Leptospira kanakyensis]|uniref:Ankyrin repeat domain-containing protein n=1 Tax=Leptospira kanakyensis TaxID=2484968 RepID=A0A6N4QQI7_9LEPT|nr:ankyrin repeat domain-containing protein [Leptospira kanakyensis]TGK55548.1 ankyrin repeat domain-containing protein [Leptospira kanakyensis]TGK61084.1 ankyrin repeat domain-containing protein [Leptospira kanakyensis]TGK76444.1 ankyrin repeat domain-containing protein [Leptospira kanakyensis]